LSGAVVACGEQVQGVLLGVVGVDAGFEHGEDLDGLAVARGGGDALLLLGAVVAGRGPQDAAQQFGGEGRGGELAGGLALGDRLHQRHAAGHLDGGELDRRDLLGRACALGVNGEHRGKRHCGEEGEGCRLLDCFFHGSSLSIVGLHLK
jgi:hypothetical protein